jgi:hypothetical protein
VPAKLIAVVASVLKAAFNRRLETKLEVEPVTLSNNPDPAVTSDPLKLTAVVVLLANTSLYLSELAAVSDDDELLANTALRLSELLNAALLAAVDANVLDNTVDPEAVNVEAVDDANKPLCFNVPP